ncbi:hypothetical protein E0504_41625 [Parafrankia sp. BMG5.11]|nr:hypothetical protein E0504_41625 [Parafrankia sp. BMG5.11]
MAVRGDVVVAEEYNLKLDDRPSHPFRGLEPVTISGRPSGLTYHHIVPYSKLRDFWNKLVENGDIKRCKFLPPLRDMISEKTYVNILSPDGRRSDAEMQAVKDLVSDIYMGRVSHGSSRLRPEGWDNLVGIYAWLPGNLFVGPTDRCDDPKDKIDDAAFRTKGARQVRRRILSESYEEILAYLKGATARKSKFASEALYKVVRYPKLQDFDLRDWTWIDGEKGPQVKG